MRLPEVGGSAPPYDAVGANEATLAVFQSGKRVQARRRLASVRSEETQMGRIAPVMWRLMLAAFAAEQTVPPTTLSRPPPRRPRCNTSPDRGHAAAAQLRPGGR